MLEKPISIAKMIEQRIEAAFLEMRQMEIEELFNPSKPFASTQGVSIEPLDPTKYITYGSEPRYLAEHLSAQAGLGAETPNVKS